MDILQLGLRDTETFLNQKTFDEKTNTEGYIKVSKFLKDKANILYEESTFSNE